MKLRRRGFVCAVTLSGLTWVTGSARAVAGGAGQAPAQPAVEDWAVWLVIDAAGGITLFHKVTDLGQGTPSSLARVIAGQLGIDPERITLRQAPVREPYLKADDDYSTSGSSGIRTSFAASRRLGATARAVGGGGDLLRDHLQRGLAAQVPERAADDDAGDDDADGDAARPAALVRCWCGRLGRGVVVRVHQKVNPREKCRRAFFTAWP